MNEIKKIQGSRLKEVRNILGLSRPKFSAWLAEHNKLGNFHEEYSSKTIEAWEQGLRKVPDDIKKLLSDNVDINGYHVQYAYLNGDTDFITQSMEAIVKKTFEIIDTSNKTTWKKASYDEILEMSNHPLNKLDSILYDELFPLYGHTRNEVFDQTRLLNIAFVEFKQIIEEYIKKEKELK